MNKIYFEKKSNFYPQILIPEKILNSFDPVELRKEMKVTDKFVITYVGAHGLANGLHQILDTAEILKDTNVVFWLIGKGMKRDTLIEDAKKKTKFLILAFASGISEKSFIIP